MPVALSEGCGRGVEGLRGARPASSAWASLRRLTVGGAIAVEHLLHCDLEQRFARACND